MSESIRQFVSERLGHSNISITLDCYSDCLPDMQREAASKLDAMLARERALWASPSKIRLRNVCKRRRCEAGVCG